MMKDIRETADLAGFLICLCLGFTFSFEVMIPTLRDIQVEMMKYLFGVGLGFGLGVCFYLIWVPIQHLIGIALEKFGAFLDSRGKKPGKGKEEGSDE
ncbi:hypothetical protein WDW37_08915 [Bdellovibrionota bacterium FG-1]